MNQKDLEALVVELQSRIATLETIAKTKRDRGPKSTREMTDTDAYRVMFGDLKDVKHKLAAEQLQLSYAQVYSARNGFTFKHIAKAGPKTEKTEA